MYSRHVRSNSGADQRRALSPQRHRNWSGVVVGTELGIVKAGSSRRAVHSEATQGQAKGAILAGAKGGGHNSFRWGRARPFCFMIFIVGYQTIEPTVERLRKRQHAPSCFHFHCVEKKPTEDPPPRTRRAFRISVLEVSGLLISPVRDPSPKMRRQSSFFVPRDVKTHSETKKAPTGAVGATEKITFPDYLTTR